MKMTDMRAKARAIFGPAIAEPMPKQPNGAKALQERANARPIPTYKVGGVVKKSKPPQPSAAEREADRKRRESLTNSKVTQSEADTLGRAMRSEGPGYKHGGKVHTSSDTARKLATEMGGMKKGGKPKKDGLAVMIAIGSPMKGMKNMKRPVKKAVGGTAAAPSPAATATAAKPYVGPGMSATTQGTDAQRRAHNAQAILQAKYSSATPNRDASAKSGSNETTRMAAGKDPASGTNTAPTKSTFDRNQAARDFTSVSSNFLKQGVPLKEITRASGELRKLQIDNKSTPAQHQAAIQSILARMNSLVPKRVAKGGIIKKAKGGMAYAKGGAMMTPVKRAAGGAAKVRKGMMSPEGKIIDAMNKIRGK